LWIKNLPKLQRTSDLTNQTRNITVRAKKCKGKPIGWREGIKGTVGGQKGRAMARSKNFSGIAKAMTEQRGIETK